MLPDKIFIINAFKVNVVIQVSAFFPHMNLSEPLKMSEVISFETVPRIALHLL